MRGKNINKNKTIENINIRNDSISNEIKLLRRNLDNNTHEVYEDLNIKKITSWRKSQNKFMKNLIFNILSFGILHLISLFFPRLYIKLYCNPRPVKECDYFLVENIYGKAILCPVKRRKDKIIANKFSIINNKGLIDDNNINTDYNNNIKNLKFYFQYKSIAYEYVENVEVENVLDVTINTQLCEAPEYFNIETEVEGNGKIEVIHKALASSRL